MRDDEETRKPGTNKDGFGTWRLGCANHSCADRVVSELGSGLLESGGLGHQFMRDDEETRKPGTNKDGFGTWRLGCANHSCGDRGVSELGAGLLESGGLGHQFMRDDEETRKPGTNKDGFGTWRLGCANHSCGDRVVSELGAGLLESGGLGHQFMRDDEETRKPGTNKDGFGTWRLGCANHSCGDRGVSELGAGLLESGGLGHQFTRDDEETRNAKAKSIEIAIVEDLRRSRTSKTCILQWHASN